MYDFEREVSGNCLQHIAYGQQIASCNLIGFSLVFFVVANYMLSVFKCGITNIEFQKLPIKLYGNFNDDDDDDNEWVSQ
jgi:cadmium resistance protein CadD (predicted permease)